MKLRALQFLIACTSLGAVTTVTYVASGDESAPPASEGQPPQAVPAAAAPPAPPPPEIAVWIAELDDNRYLVREEATRRLLAAGAPALEPLLAAANGNRPESADRAIWILKKLGRSNDPSVAWAALIRLVQLRDRPNLVAAAQAELVRVSFLKCKRSLEALGAEVTAQLEGIPPAGGAANVVQVQLGEKWRGKTEDLSTLVEATYHQHFRLVGTRVDDAAVKLFEAKQDLAWLQLINTRATVAAVDSLKTRRPNANVYVRNQALLGLAARSRGGGVGVEMVQPGSGAAAAGIKEGDVLLALDGHALRDFDRMTAHIAQHKPGDKIQLDIQRGNEKLKVEATLGSWPEQPQ